MKLAAGIVDDLPLRGAAAKAVGTSLLQMPHLISERSLSDAADALAEETSARAKRGFVPTIETIAMPKRGFGPRPIGLLAPTTRTLYQAIVDKLTPHLPSPSRARDMEEHRVFGTNAGRPEEERIVDFDIAACYEYIDHAILTDELVMQSFDADTAGALTLLLSEVFPRGIGIPQAMEPSHLLADAYLERVVRGIIRSGYEVDRYADDFRVVTPNWGSAHEAIERSVEIARHLGLALADGKTEIRSAQQIRDEIAEREAALTAYRAAAADELRSIDFVSVGYDEFEMVEVEADDEAVDYMALTRVVEDWVAGDREQRSVHAYFGSRALRVLQSAPDRVDDEWLVEIAEREPIRLHSIVNYLRARPEAEENWSALARLTEMPRQSPWARLWMARVADMFESGGSAGQRQVLDWARRQLADRYEVVRAEAAWLLASHGEVGVQELAPLYVGASDISRLGIAASAGRADGHTSSNVGASIRDDGELSKHAYSWGQALAR